MNFQLSIQQKTRVDNYCRNISMEEIFWNMENSKTTEPHKLVLN